ncbi:Hypothetical_protein [Hexamita inflata]|uniref:Hypothetical_protein n=1 Tax=Hexamita inflata TaxID=28002 RepID=A0AA86NS17_9EUKA|nr:Hypothetical protein HINF_LOCUS11435 [Hexamita inflata]
MRQAQLAESVMDQVCENQLSGIVWVLHFLSPSSFSVVSLNCDEYELVAEAIETACIFKSLRATRHCNSSGSFADQWNRALEIPPARIGRAFTIISNGGHEPYSNNALQPSCDSMCRRLLLRSCSEEASNFRNQLCKNIKVGTINESVSNLCGYNNNNNRPKKWPQAKRRKPCKYLCILILLF